MGKRTASTALAQRTLALATVLILAVLGGCGGLTTKQKDAVGELGKASAAVGTAASTQIQDMRDTTVQMNLERLTLLGYVQPTPEQLTAMGGKDPQGPAALDHGFELDQVKLINSGTKALVNYGTVLVALVDDTQSAKLKTAAAGFTSDLSSLSAVNVTLSADQRTAIGGLAESIGGFIVAEKRKTAVLKFVMGSQDNVSAICDFLAGAFDTDGGHISRTFDDTRVALLNPAFDALLAGKTYQARHDGQLGMKLAFDNDKSRKQTLAQISSAAGDMKKANATLVTALHDPTKSFDDVINFAQQAQALQDAIQGAVKPGANVNVNAGK